VQDCSHTSGAADRDNKEPLLDRRRNSSSMPSADETSPATFFLLPKTNKAMPACVSMSSRYAVHRRLRSVASEIAIGKGRGGRRRGPLRQTRRNGLLRPSGLFTGRKARISWKWRGILYIYGCALEPLKWGRELAVTVRDSNQLKLRHFTTPRRIAGNC
jgi:hypothetical protein